MNKDPRTMNYRERWYFERNLPYEHPKLENCPPFKCLGFIAGEKKRMREPGEDDE